MSTLTQLKTGLINNLIKWDQDFIVNDMKLIPNYETMSSDLELVKHICNMVEELNRKEVDPKIVKKAKLGVKVATISIISLFL